MKLLVIGALVAGPFDASAAKPPHVLTTPALRALIQGKVVRPFSGLGQWQIEHFARDGTYGSTKQEFEDEGSYTVQNNQVCVSSTVMQNRCRFVLVDEEGRLWFVEDLSRSRFYQIRVSK